MAPFATATQLAGHVQADVDTYSAEQAVAVASGFIRSHCGWSITQDTVTGQLVDGTGQRSVWLPTLYLTAVASVAEDGLPLVYDTDYTWTVDGRLYRGGYALWPYRPRLLTVTYTHGYPTVPDAVLGACLAIAARIYVNPASNRSETIGGVSWTAAGTAAEIGPGLTDSERMALAPYRLLGVA